MDELILVHPCGQGHRHGCRGAGEMMAFHGTSREALRCAGTRRVVPSPSCLAPVRRPCARGSGGVL
ncbi:MAG TPA: hypothetical protein VGN34_15800 [Ktedonobacteraceae bacterium]